MKSDLLSLIGLAAKAGKICYGETLFNTFRKGNVHFVFIGNDQSARSLKQIHNKCLYYQVPYIEDFDSETLSRVIGKTNIKNIGITDKNFTQLINKRRETDGKTSEEKKEQQQ